MLRAYIYLPFRSVVPSFDIIKHHRALGTIQITQKINVCILAEN